MKKATQWRIARPASYALLLVFALLFANVKRVAAQVAVPCPQNIDFSFGNFNNWKCYVDAAPVSQGPIYNGWTFTGPVSGTPPGSGPGNSRHVLTTGSGLDYYGGFPEVAPGGGLFSLRLGNDDIGAHAEMVRYYIHVPVGFNNYSFNFKYAVVFEDPGHAPSDQPRFTVTGYDSATGAPVPCATQTYVAGAGLPGFQASSVGSKPLFLPWTTGNLNLSGSGGKTVIIEVVSQDCTATGHFGYGYFDVVSCGQFNATITYCDLKSGILTLSGPPGYQKYEWWNQNFTTRLNAAPYAAQTINVPAPVTCQYYNLVITPYNQNGCPDTIRTRRLCDFQVNASPDSVCNTLGKPIPLNVTATGGLGGFTYKWTGDTTLSCYGCTSPVASPISSGYYVATVTDSNGCFRQDTVRVENPGFKVNLGPDITTCLGTPVNLNPTVTPANGPGYIFTWIPGAGISDPTILKPTYTPSAVGTQKFVLRVDSGICATSDTMNIRTLPNTYDPVDTAVCAKDSIVLHLNDADTNFTYLWTFTGPQPFGNNQVLHFQFPATDSSEQKPGFKADTTRTFTITAKYPKCPDIVKQLKVRVEPIPIVSLGADIVNKCKYAPVYLTTKVGPSWFGNYTYQWKANDFIDKVNSPIILFTGDEDTTLRVTVTTPLGCAGQDVVRIHVWPSDFGTLSPIDPQLCPRGRVTLTAGGGASYRWSPALYLSDSASAVVNSAPVSTTDYTLYVNDVHGCVDTLHTTVTVNPEGTVTLPDTVILYPGESYELNPQGNLLYYSWFPTVGLSPSASVANPIASPSVNTRYYVSGTTEAGCPASDSVYILVREESAIGMANAFSPGSAPNAEFKVSHLGTATLKSFRIYDRWGVKVFETSDINKGWDGTFNGAPQPMGVYIYTVEALSNSGKPFVKQGNVTLLR